MSENLESEVVLGLLPSGWSWVRVADLGVLGEQTVLTGPFGSNLRSDDFIADVADAVPVLTIGCLQSRGIDRAKAVFIGADKAAEMERYRLRHGDVMFSRMATVGRAGLIGPEYEGALFNYHLMRLRLEKSVIEPYFFIYFVRGAQVVTDHVRSVNHGVTRDGINTSQLIAMPVALAPRREQQRVVEAIESYFTRLDDAVATLERVERNLKRYRVSVLKCAVEGRLVPTQAALAKQEGRDYEPASVLLERILAERRRRWSESGKKSKFQAPISPDTTNLPDLPEGWCWVTVDQVCSHIVDCPHSTPQWADAGHICVRTTEFLPGHLDLTGARFVSQAIYEERIQRLQPQPGDVLYSREGGILGIACQVPRGVELCLGQRMMLMRAARPACARYLMHLLNSPLILKRVHELTSGSASPHLNVGDIRSFRIPLPPEAEALRIADAVDDIFSIVDSADAAIAANLTRSGRFRQSILKWAFEGKLANQDPNDEPASVLLEHIKAERAAYKPAKPTRSKRDAGKKKRA